MKNSSRRCFVGLGVVLGIAQIALVWLYRYLPMGDYPVWLYEAQSVCRLLAGDEAYAKMFQLVSGPVPNMAFEGCVLLLASLFSFETAGKIVLSVCIVAFPWSWYLTTRRIAGEKGGLEFLGFPLSLNLFFWGRTSYLLAFILFIMMAGWMRDHTEKLHGHDLLVIAILTILFFFLHGAVFGLWCFTVIVVLLSAARPITERLRMVGIMFVPAAALVIWYLLEVDVPEAVVPTWGLWSLARNILKPLMLFIKSYGVPTLLPLSVLNGMWLLLLGFCMWPVVRTLLSRRDSRHPFGLVALVCLIATLILPNDAFGIASPGAYCVLPGLLLITLGGPQRASSPLIPTLLFCAAFILTIHAFDHVRRVDAMMTECVEDTRRYVNPGTLHTTIGFDWPAETAPSDALSASVNPLYGAQYYVLLEIQGFARIHETSILQLRSDREWIRPPFRGGTRDVYHESVIEHIEWCRRFGALTITGMNREAAQTIDLLRSVGFSPVCTRPLWTILVRNTNEWTP